MAVDNVVDALQEAIDIKEDIRTAIIGKEVAVPADTPFAEYPNKVNAIKGILQTKTITPTAAGGTVTPDSGYDGFSSVTLPEEVNLIPANISRGTSIYGVVGTADTATFDIEKFFARTLTDLTLGVPTIGSYMFYQNTTLQSFTDTSLTDLGQYAFYNCSGLRSFTAGTSYKTIAPYTFYSCGALATFDMSNIESIGTYGLYNCSRVANIGRLHTSDVGSYGCYYLSNSASNGFVYDPTEPAAIGDYGFQYAKITEVAGEIKSIGNYGLANLGSTFTTISAEFNGTIGSYGLANNQYVKTVDFSNSNITNLGTYAMYYLGWNRSGYSSDPHMELDFRKSTFSTVDQYAMAYIRYANIYLPSKVSQINAYAFQSCQYVNIYMQGAAPVLSSTSAFSSASNYKIYAPWTNLASYQNGTNWSSLSSNLIGYAAAGSFEAGATLPEYNAEGYAVTWYSDEAKTTQVTTCPAGSPMLYCSIGSTKVKQVITVAIDGPITLDITDASGSAVDYSYGFILCAAGDVYNINATTLDGYTCYIKVDGTKITTFPYQLTVGASDVSIAGTAYDPTSVNPDFAEATWRQLKTAVETGVATSLYADSIGATREITLTNGQTIHLRLSNNTADMYELADGSGTTGFVLEFVELLNTTYPMNQTNTNVGGWSASYMKNTVMPLIFDMLPDDLKDVIATIKRKTCYSGNDGTLVESEDTLFLPTERNVFSSRNYSRVEEWNASTRWQYYAQNDTNTARIKYLNGSASTWWLCSVRDGSTNNFCSTNSSGNAYITNAYINRGVGPSLCL